MTYAACADIEQAITYRYTHLHRRKHAHVHISSTCNCILIRIQLSKYLLKPSPMTNRCLPSEDLGESALVLLQGVFDSRGKRLGTKHPPGRAEAGRLMKPGTWNTPAVLAPRKWDQARELQASRDPKQWMLTHSRGTQSLTLSKLGGMFSGSHRITTTLCVTGPSRASPGSLLEKQNVRDRHNPPQNPPGSESAL